MAGLFQARDDELGVGPVVLNQQNTQKAVSLKRKYRTQA